MDSNSITQNEQFIAMQQRLLQLEQIVAQSSAQPSAEPVSSPNVNMVDDEEEENMSSLHSLPVRPSYSWSPSPFLTEVLSLDSSLFPTTMLTDDERRKTIDQYPNIDNLQYQPPDTIPTAARKINKYQVKQDMSLKRLQYLLSGVFRPLDVLGLEISQDTNNANIQRYLHMLKDCRELLLNVSAQINDMRNNIAFQAINPSFSSSLTQGKFFTMAPADFQAALVQQTNASQAVKTASGLRNKKRTFNQNQPIPPQQFFRSGPSSQQGGYITNSNSNNNNSSWQHNKQYRNTNRNNGNNKGKATNNPFRNNNQQ
ncbi:hypothetical protein INT45_002195 [Circinella minor]|uniref:Uncharacterized protein n=1 Tax=Circinella minor TaxID=1195481 RepID=A0A8H7RS31_9FUNG|nr:hypothetical protein INT45_002195 [Circinella minor]